MDTWISIDERLPDEIGYYLAVVDKSVASLRQGPVEIQECYTTVKGNEIVVKFQDYVTHWQPLPEPPEQKPVHTQQEIDAWDSID
jgi:Protein of unknown function (DUF551)